MSKFLFAFLFATAGFIVSAQPGGSNKQYKEPFTEYDWNKLPQSAKDSINKLILLEFQEARKAAETTDEANANQIIEDALKDINGTTRLNFIAYPKAQFTDAIAQLKNVEEFSCQRCRQLELNALFTQLAKLPKLKKVSLEQGNFKAIPNNSNRVLIPLLKIHRSPL